MNETEKYEAMELEQMIHDAGYPEWNDKYEGYTKGEWVWLYNDEVPIHVLCVSQGVIGIGVEPDDNVSEADMRLIADAPRLLEEVKRLQRYERDHEELWDVIRNFSPQDSEEDDDIYQQWLDSVSQGYMGSVYEYAMMKREEVTE